MSETYTVVLLVEQALTAADAAQVRSLHEGLDDEVHYHVLLPAEDAAARVEAAMGTSAATRLPAPRRSPADPEMLEAVREETERESAARPAGRPWRRSTAPAPMPTARSSTRTPSSALGATVSRVDGREVIILTRPHVVSEFFHRDWTSRARRKIGVPVLHLLEHESFDEQAGSGEGVTGL